MRVLVTGAGGFVGSWLLRDLLGEGHEVFAGTSDPLPPEGGGARWVALDVTSDDSVRRAVEAAAPDAVYHLAGQSSVGASFGDPLGTWDVNATGTLRLVHALPEGARLLFVGSGEAYGVVPEAEQPLREERPLRPTNPYAASKAAAEMAVLAAAASGRVHAVAARSFNHTGPGQDTRFAIASFAKQLAALRAGRGPAVLRVGNLSPRRDMLDVRDVVRAYRLLMERGESGAVYNVASGEAPSIGEMLDVLVELSGTGARVEVDPERVRPTDVPVLRGDATRLRALGWEPRIGLRQTLADLLEHEARALDAAEAA